MERILALSNRTASSARALRLMLASMGIEVNGRGTDIYIYTHTHDTTYARHAFNHQGQRRWKIQVVRGREGRWNPLATVTYVVLKCQLAAAQTLPDTLSYRRRMIIGEIDSAIPPFRPPFRFTLWYRIPARNNPVEAQGGGCSSEEARYFCRRPRDRKRVPNEEWRLG